MRLRVAGVIVLLYPQPVSRIVRLSVNDVVRDGDMVLLRLGDSASPGPAPVAALLLEHIATRDNMYTATKPASRWLFPGRRAGQPSRPDHLSALLNEIGVPAAAARGAAIRQRLLELPGPVVVDALGYHATRPLADASERPAHTRATSTYPSTKAEHHTWCRKGTRYRSGRGRAVTASGGEGNGVASGRR